MAKFCGFLLVALCVIPVTAPFSSIDVTAAALISHHDGGACLATPVTGVDEDAVVLERSDFLSQSQGCASPTLTILRV